MKYCKACHNMQHYWLFNMSFTPICRIGSLSTFLICMTFSSRPSTCNGDYVTITSPSFSPDAAVVAFIRKRTITALPVGGSEVVGRSVEIVWAMKPSYSNWRVYQIPPEKQPQTPAERFVRADYEISPDSTQMCISASNGIRILNLHTGAERCLTQDCGGSLLAWRSDEEIIYDTISLDIINKTVTRRYWSHVLNGTPDSRRLVAEIKDTDTIIEPSCFLSPNRHESIIISPTATRPWRCLLLQQKHQVDFGNPGDALATASWRRDGNRVLCVASPIEGADIQGYLFDISAMKFEDVSKELRELKPQLTSKAVKSSEPWYLPNQLWDSDGKHITFVRGGLRVCVDGCLGNGELSHDFQIEKRSFDGHVDELWQLSREGYCLGVISPTGSRSTLSKFGVLVENSGAFSLRTDLNSIGGSNMRGRFGLEHVISFDGSMVIERDDTIRSYRVRRLVRPIFAN